MIPKLRAQVRFSFHVYRSTSLPVDTTGEPVRCDVRSIARADGQNQYGCTDITTAAETTYHYAVKGYDNGGRESVASNTASVTTLVPDLTPPAAVSGVTAKATEYGIALDWKANTESDLGWYVVYVGEVLRGDDGKTVCSGTDYAYPNKSTTHYLYPAKPDGGEYCFWIDAVDTRGNSNYRRTKLADVQIVTALDLTPTVPTPPGSPLYLSVRTDRQSGVELAWNAVEGATGYRVYRWDRAAGRYAPLADPDPRAFTWYTDTTAASGTTHYYWVTAVLADGTETAPGAGWARIPPAAG
ncbi:hypothetical protein OH809_22435 [Streptomyces sp. NBC_00873]|uniref:fibronectin type III domain-containing protein n=1 Tax=unclassified Streptomyces TaxID=2593676 RepID=UPI00386FFFC1|nr:hypothetical protein OH809_22435 [Streptomyces sp. NBC_00873]WTA44769.1 hypothetical protein OH821_20860 [Streptomyces sp. NBC_00842]